MIDFQNAVLGYSAAAPKLGPLDLSIPAGQLIALIGPNGSGKSTLLRSLVGETRLFAGSVSIDGERVEAALSKSKIAYVAQDPIAPDHLRVFDLAALGLWHRRSLFGKLTPEQVVRVETILDRMGLARLAHRTCGELSIGERQRVLLARALIQEPKILVLDEPTNHLDPAAQKLLWTTLCEECRNAGTSIWVATHDLHRTESYADRIVALRERTLFAHGDSKSFWGSVLPAELFGDFQ